MGEFGTLQVLGFQALEACAINIFRLFYENIEIMHLQSIGLLLITFSSNKF